MFINVIDVDVINSLFFEGEVVTVMNSGLSLLSPLLLIVETKSLSRYSSKHLFALSGGFR